jgi:hypothetical protein
MSDDTTSAARYFSAIGANLHKDRDGDIFYLDLSDKRITDVDFLQLSMLLKLKSLVFDECNFWEDTAAGFVHLRGLAHLEDLSCNYTSVCDNAIAHLAGLTSLRELDLFCCTDITDSSLVHLSKLRHLKRLNVAATSITDAGRTTLKNVLPDCKVHF